MLDTGSSIDMITDTLVAKAGLKREPLFGKDGQRIKLFDEVPLDTVKCKYKLGDFDFDDERPSFAVTDAARLAKMNPSVDGVVGLGVFTNAGVLLDFQQRTVTLVYPGNLPRDILVKLKMQDAFLVERSPQPTGLFYVPVSFGGGIPENLAIDTGAYYTGLSSAAARRLHVKAQVHASSPTMWGLIPLRSGVVDGAQLGSIKLGHIPVDWPEKADIPGIPPCVGLDVLGRFRVLMDYQANKLYLQPATFPLGPDVDVRWDNNGDLRVTRVSKGRAPDIAGLRVGDFIEGVGTGMPTPGSLWSIADCAAKPVGVDVDLCVRHAGGQTAERIVFHAAPAATPARR